MHRIKVKRLSKDATLPTRAYEDDAGLDLYAVQDVSYKNTDVVVVVNTDIAMAIDSGFVGLICDRSSMGRAGWKVVGGVVDAQFRGPISVMLFNLDKKDGCFRKGQKIAQILMVPVALPVVKEVDSLDDTARGANGFGSSG